MRHALLRPSAERRYARRMLTKHAISVEELLAMPNAEEYELSRGELVHVNPNNPTHGRLAAEIAAAMISYVRPRRLGTTMVEAGFVLARNPDTMRGPDVSFLRAARAAGLPSRGFIEGPPDLAVEVVSPDNTRRYLLSKAGEYIAAGTSLVWIIDPYEQSAVVITAAGRSELGRRGILDGADVIPGFQLRLDGLFEAP